MTVLEAATCTALDHLDLQLIAGADEVVLTRDEATAISEAIALLTKTVDLLTNHKEETP